MAAMSVEHARVDNQTVGSHRLVSPLPKGSSEVASPESPQGPPTWDLPLVLHALCFPPFEPLVGTGRAEMAVGKDHVPVLAITSAKRVGANYMPYLVNRALCLRWNSRWLRCHSVVEHSVPP